MRAVNMSASACRRMIAARLVRPVRQSTIDAPAKASIKSITAARGQSPSAASAAKTTELPTRAAMAAPRNGSTKPDEARSRKACARASHGVVARPRGKAIAAGGRLMESLRPLLLECDFDFDD